MTALLLLVALTCPAQAGSYTGPVYSGGTHLLPYGQIADGSVSGGWGGNSGNVPSASCTGTITATFTWVPAPGLTATSDPPPQQVILTETVTASASAISHPATPLASATYDDGLGGSGAGTAVISYNGTLPITSSATVSRDKTKSSVMSGGASVRVTRTPTATGTGVGAIGSASVSYSAAVSAVTINLGGTLDPTHGNYHVLTGQQITATLQGIPSGFTVTKYTWSQPSATCLKTYNEKAASNQLIALGASDLTGPATGSATVSALNFYDSKQEDLTVTCAVTMTAPDGKTVLNVTAKSPQVIVLKPTASWGIDPKTLPVSGVPNVTSVNTNVGFQDNSKAATQSYGAVTIWYPITISLPVPFTSTGGQGCFAQISTPVNSVTRTPIGAGVSTYNLKIQNTQGKWVAPLKGLDKDFPYPEGYKIDAFGNVTDTTGDSTFTVGNIGGSGDAPSGAENPPDQDKGGVNWTSGILDEKFNTWLMYKPPGGVWIPLQTASWSVTGKAVGGPSNWSATGTYKAPSPSNIDSFPQWDTKITGMQYQP